MLVFENIKRKETVNIPKSTTTRGEGAKARPVSSIGLIIRRPQTSSRLGTRLTASSSTAKAVIATNDLKNQELTMLALNLPQIGLVYINTLMIHQVQNFSPQFMIWVPSA
jgi:hypothetical protein